MTEALYVRLRGRVLGPFDEEKLRALARRGQLGRLHQLSADGVNWSPASTYPHLFVPADGQARRAAEAPPAGQPQPAGGPAWSAKPAEPRKPAAAADTDPRQWYYELDGQENGPVSRAALMDGIASGRLKPTNQVWAEGMEGWVMAGEVPELAHVFPAQQPQEAAQPTVAARDAEELPAHLCRAAVDSRPWVMTIGIITLVFAAPGGLFGFILLVTGAGRGVPFFVLVGISYLVAALVQIVAAFMLLQYASRLAILRYNKAPIILTKALQTVGVFWTYIAILMLVGILLTFFGIVWVMAFAEAPPVWGPP